MPICSRCETEKDRSQFYAKQCKKGHSSWCIDCLRKDTNVRAAAKRMETAEAKAPTIIPFRWQDFGVTIETLRPFYRIANKFEGKS